MTDDTPAPLGRCPHGNPAYLCIVCEQDRADTPAPVAQPLVVRVEDMNPVELAYAEAMHEDCGESPAGRHPLADHSPWSGSDLDGVESWGDFTARLARHGLMLALETARLVPVNGLRYALRTEMGWSDFEIEGFIEEYHLAAARSVPDATCSYCGGQGWFGDKVTCSECGGIGRVARSVPDNAALREAREHIADGHRCDETRGDCLGHMEDVYASLMWPAAAPASPAGLDPRVAEAFDLLGGMWSWHDASITAEPGKPGGLSETWYVKAGRILREVVGRPASPAALASPEEARPDA